MSDYKNGLLFNDELMKEIREQFHNINTCPYTGEERLYFDNAGGAFRLKKAVSEFARLDEMPDCPERVHGTAMYMKDIMEKGIADIRTIFGALTGSVITELTASQVIFSITGAITENIEGTNIVTTALEHPSAFDACEFFAAKTGKQLRVADTNPITGGVDTEAILKHIDKDTCLLSVIFASNISGAILDIEDIVKRAREIKPDLYIIIDSVQHVPHGIVNADELGVDGVNFAPYKFFGVRGSGIGWVSDRVAKLKHRKLSGKPENEWEHGSPAPGHYAVITEIVDYVCSIGSRFSDEQDRTLLFRQGMNAVKLHERALLDFMLNGDEQTQGLRDMQGVSVLLDYPDLTKRDFILAMSIEGMDYTQAVREYEKRNVIVYERIRSSIYSKRMLESFDVDGMIRVSPLHCNSIEDIRKFLDVTKEIRDLV